MSCNYAEGLSPYDNKGKLGGAEKFDSPEVVEDKVDQLAKMIQEAKHIVLHTGAGISTSAGIPDFRGPKGVWTLEEKGLKPDINISWDDAKPTPTHMAIAKLVELDIVKFVITQNIDGLHLRSGVPRKNLAELHGNMFVDQCDKCKKMIVRDSPAPTVGQKFTGDDCPAHKDNGRKCRGKLRDFVLDWEDNLPDDDLTISDTHSMMADLSIVMGSTLQIIPAGNMPLYAKKYHEEGKLVICNLQPTKHFNKADLNIHTYVDNIMEKLFLKLGLSIPEYCKDQDPVRQVLEGRDLPETGYIDYTQCSVLAKTLKKQGDVIHDKYLKMKREEKKRKSLEPERNTKLIKLEKPLEKKPKALIHKKSVKIVQTKSTEIKKSVKTESKYSLLVHQEVIDVDSSDSSNDDVKIMDDFKVEVKEVISNHTKDNSDDSSDIEVITEIQQKSNVSENCIKSDTEISTFTNIKTAENVTKSEQIADLDNENAQSKEVPFTKIEVIKDLAKSDLNGSNVESNNENAQSKEAAFTKIEVSEDLTKSDLNVSNVEVQNENAQSSESAFAKIIDTEDVTKSDLNGSNGETDSENVQSSEVVKRDKIFEDIKVVKEISVTDDNRSIDSSNESFENNKELKDIKEVKEISATARDLDSSKESFDSDKALEDISVTKATEIIEKNGSELKEFIKNGKDAIDDATDAILELN